MLLVIMMSAAPTGGAPRTQLFGSAFDPATYSVTTAPKRQSRMAGLHEIKSGADEPEDFHWQHYPGVRYAAAPTSGANTRESTSPRARPDDGAPAHPIARNRAARGPPAS